MLGTFIAIWPTPDADKVKRTAEAAAPGQLQLAGD
jgi:hypothetical protein